MASQPAPLSVPIIIQDEDDSAIARYLATLFDRRWLILKVTLVTMLLGGMYALVARPVFEASMLIHVEEPSTKESKNILGEMATLFEVKTTTPSEMELLRSRLVIARAIEDLHLFIEVHPFYMPVVGRWLAEHSRQTPLGALLGTDAGEAAQDAVTVSRFDMPMTMEETDFDLTAGPGQTYRLQQDALHINAVGRAGERLAINTDQGPIVIMVEQMTAKPGEHFTVRRRRRLMMVEEMQKAMTITELGKQSGVISITLRGEDARAVHAMLRQIGQQYIAQNLARKLEESQKSLAFLDKQLPDLKQQLERAEAKYSQFRNKNGTVDLSEEEKIALQQVATARARRLALQQRRTELLPHFTPNHPMVIAVDSQIREVNAEIADVTAHIRTLPLMEQEVQRLNREVRVSTDLYTALSNTAQQLRLITIGKVGNVRLVDTPMMPEAPVSPNRIRITAMAALAGLLGSMLFILGRKAFYGGIDEPEQIENLLQIPVFATIPHSRRQEHLQRRLPRSAGRMSLLAYAASDDVAIESMRTFRTALQFSLKDARNNIVLITGPMSGVGKSFISVNMAAVVAMTGKRVMLIDGDLRNGRLHDHFDVPAPGGLSDYLRGDCTLAHIIHRNVIDHLDFISTGSQQQHPAELLLSHKLGTLLAALSHAYDLVMIDAAPALAVSDSIIVAAHAGSIYLVARAGITTAGELQESLRRLKQAGLAPRGVLFNDLKLHAHGNYHYPYPYGSARPIQVGWDASPKSDPERPSQGQADSAQSADETTTAPQPSA
jgi:tyrosine-protein kinase Etk/Wzc